MTFCPILLKFQAVKKGPKYRESCKFVFWRLFTIPDETCGLLPLLMNDHCFIPQKNVIEHLGTYGRLTFPPYKWLVGSSILCNYMILVLTIFSFSIFFNLLKTFILPFMLFVNFSTTNFSSGSQDQGTRRTDIGTVNPKCWFSQVKQSINSLMALNIQILTWYTITPLRVTQTPRVSIIFGANYPCYS